MIEKMIARLPDAYNKDRQSNIHKLIQLAADQLQSGEETLQLIHDWRDVDQAQGKALDRLGKDVGQPREGLNDEQYRQKVKIKIRANLSGGEIETLNSICLVLLGDRFKGIQEGWNLSENHPIGPVPAMMLFTVKSDGVNYGIPMAEIDDISAGGVAANWELIIDNALDLAQTDFRTYSNRYTLSGEEKSRVGQHNGSFGETDIEMETRYLSSMHRLRTSGADQQSTVFKNDALEYQTEYIASLHNPLRSGVAKAGEGVIL